MRDTMNRDHARAEWAFFRRAHCGSAQMIRRQWARRYALIRGWCLHAKINPFDL